MAAPLSVGSRGEGVLSLVGDGGVLYLHLTQWYKDLDHLMTSMTREYETGAGAGASLQSGAQTRLVAVKYPQDNCWYRGRLVGAEGEKYQVFFIDYGNLEEVEWSRLRELLPQYQDQPPLVLSCRLYGLKRAEEWTGTDSQVMISYFARRADGEKPYAIHLATLGPNNVYEIDMSPKGASTTNLCNREILAEMNRGGGSRGGTPTTGDRPAQSLPTLSPQSLIGGGLKDVRLSYVKSSGHFYLTLADGLDELQAGLQTFYNSPRGLRYKISAGHGRKGRLCAARFQGEWYRAVITDTSHSAAGQLLGLFFIDFGNRVDGIPAADHSQVAFLKDDFAEAARGLRCAAHNLPDSEAPEVIAYLESCLETVPLKAHFHGHDDENGYQVEMLNLQPENGLEDSLNAGLARLLLSKGKVGGGGEGGASSKAWTWEASPSELEGLKSSGSCFFLRGFPALPLPGVAEGSWMSFLVAFVESPAKIFVQLPENAATILRIQASLQARKSGGGVTAWRVGDLCSAKSVDGAWYRGIVVGARPDGGYDVYMVDYGNVEEGLRADALEPLPAALRAEPPQAFPLRFLEQHPKDSLVQGLQDTHIHVRFAANVAKASAVSFPVAEVLVAVPNGNPVPLRSCLS